MGTSNSAAKRYRQSEKRRIKNRAAKSQVKTVTKSFMAAVKSGDKEAAEVKYKEMAKLMDTASGKGVYHSNTVARKKSRMNKLLNSISAE
ncbi:MAG: 30S ribosomal protein S20 [Spirochaetales bacterium]|uniref:Small ribosomal subunit protein bS20 n=1 Tax=Candidatus Thalassospirochaeta sargassi TaxID=3119039 RepID=A0AAJ1I9U9_9SPIO|nr:30S ribosomal protein S20 [Spirochaetales bacterium]